MKRFSLLLAGCLAATVAGAQELPQKTITLVVGFVAGGGADTAARIIARKVSDNLKQTVVIDNRAGAGGNLAHQYVATATPDGATILLGSVGPLAVAPHMMKVGYDPLKDLAPLTMGVTFPNVLVVNSALGVKTLAEYIALAKAKPGGLEYASTGSGSASHLAGELFNARAALVGDVKDLDPGAQAMQDVLSGRVAAYFSVPSTAEPLPPSLRGADRRFLSRLPALGAGRGRGGCRHERPVVDGGRTGGRLRRFRASQPDLQAHVRHRPGESRRGAGPVDASPSFEMSSSDS